MLRTDSDIVEVGLEIDWSDTISWIVKRVGNTFYECPDCFFTEHDIHSVLCNVANEELQLYGLTNPQRTSDGHQVGLVHHEYPTPFRCDMKRYKFEKKNEKPYKRGHYDLAILNPEFVRNNELSAVCGKDYQKFKSAMQEVKVDPLIWICEVMFFPRVKRLPKNALKIIEQDTLKVKETLKHKVDDDVCFCKTGSVLVFTSHTAEEATKLKQEITRLGKKHEIEVILSTA